MERERGAHGEQKHKQSSHRGAGGTGVAAGRLHRSVRRQVRCHGQRRVRSSRAAHGDLSGAVRQAGDPIDRSKNVTLPGWGGFTIPAKTKKITQGFEFHNPAENLWYEDWVSLDGTTLEKLVVDSGQTTELSHYLRLAGIQAEVTKVLDADPAYFEIQKTDAGAYTIEAVKGYKGEKTLTVQTDDGKQYTLTLTGKEECYYIAFGLYLEDGDELLFQSGLVAPGLYVQKMEMTRALAPGEYPAYVVCQPYLSDRTTKTNSGIVKLTLTVG